MSVDDVIAAIDVHRLAGDQLGAVHGEHGDGHADIINRDKTSARRLRLRLLRASRAFLSPARSSTPLAAAAASPIGGLEPRS